MSIKDLFYKNAPSKVVTSASLDQLASKVESADYVAEYSKDAEEYIPVVNFENPEEFAAFGSAEEYYVQSVQRIYQTYPYDGSRKERTEWHLSSSYLDRYIFDKVYPTSTGVLLLGKPTWGSSQTSEDDASGIDTFDLSDNPQYITVNGGPNAASIHAHTASSAIQTNFKDERQKANVYHTGSYREANFMIDGNEGNTVEFWLKKASFGKSQASSSATPTSHCYFDLWNSSTDSGSSGDYGRLMIETRELKGTDGNYVEDKIFHVTYKSGSAGVEQLGVGDASILSASAFTDWNHYAFSFRNVSSEVEVKLYINGVLKETTTGGTNIGKVTKDPLNAVIGAYKRGPTVTAANAGVTTGWGSISGSIDEFRYWKANRTSDQISQNWFMPIGGGTNTDSANTKLGVYFKFNEGVTDNDDIDKKVLDYSGRISNGTINNYHTDMRHSGSAIISGSAAKREQGDPIIYSSHPEVKALEERLQDEGRTYDYGNPSSIYKSIPAWIMEEDEIKGNTAKILAQIISSYFDTLHMQIRELSNLRNIRYMSGSSDKPMPFANKLLSSTGMVVPEIFANADVIEQFLGANDERVFKEKLHNIKNFIYHNIYNNLTFINKSKGTEKSIRNMLRCFGVDDELYKLNMYTNNGTFATDNNYRLTSTKKKFVDFDFGTRNNATVYQYKNPSNANAVDFLTASYNASTGFDSNLGLTFEAEILLPKKPQPWEPAYGSREFRASGSSVFGAHTIDKESEYSVEETVDHGNFKVEVIRPDMSNRNYEQHSDAYFKLSSYNNGVIPDLTSSIFLDAYDNSKWNLAVTVQPRKYIHTSYVSGTSGEQNDLQEDVAGYVVEFRGVSAIGDHIKDEFSVTQSITDEQGKQFVTSPKRMFCGAHRANFTGSVISKSDVRISSVRNWTIPLSQNDLRSHARDTKNYGVERPFESAYMNQVSGTTVVIPKIETLALHWDFETVTGSDDSGEFYVEDASSGSLDYNRYGTEFGKLLESQHTGRGFGFNANSDSVFINEYVLAAKQQLPESLRTDNMVEVLERDDEFFTRDRMPVSYFAALEKSMYQTISEEMINMFAGATQLNSFVDLFSRPVDKYRQSYKRMRQARNVFFDKVNNVPDLEKYLNYYKWLDDAISTMVAQLIPASMDAIEVRNIVESHILERNKYWHKYPTLEMKFDDPEGTASGINTHMYNWQFGHAPLNPTNGREDGDSNEAEQTQWWLHRAERSRAPLDSGNSLIDNSRALLHTASYQAFNRQLNSPVAFSMDPVVIQRTNKSAVFKSNTIFNTSNYIAVRPEDIETKRLSLDEKTTNDQRGLTTKQKLGVFGKIFSQTDNASTQYYKNVVPFSIYSASVPAMSQSTTSADAILSNKTGRDSLLLTNLHNDTYHENFDAVLQSPFTDTHVGGSQHRHVGLNPSVTQDTAKTRPEAWKIDFQTDGELRIYSPYGSPDSEDSAHEMPRARYSRDELAKRPINIRNIANENLPSGSMMRWGNYDKNYQVVQIAGRAQDSYLVDNVNAREYEGKIGKKSESTAISGNIDFELPTRTRNESYIVERFSAPGDASTLSRGFLDVETETYSVYNALPYRNLSVRAPLLTMLTASCGAFGLYAGNIHHPEGQEGGIRANYHKVNRNGATRKRLKEGFSSTEGGSSNFEEVTIKDNYFIQHPIPQSSMQYSWITASATSGPFGHEQPDASNASLASTDITFLSASEHGTFMDADGSRVIGEESEISGTLTPNANFAFTDFAGINFHVYEPVTGSLRKLGHPAGTSLFSSDNENIDNQYANRAVINDIVGPDDEVTTIQEAGPRIFNALMLHRNGPYGYPSWKQIRTGDHPVARHFKSSNTMLHTKMVTNVITAMGADFKVTKKEKTFEVIEPVVSSKHHPMVHNFYLNQEENNSIQLVHTYANNLTRFSNQNFNGFLGLQNTETQMYDSLKKEYIDGELSVPLPGHGNDPFNQQPWDHTGRAFKSVNYIIYKETVYPADYNTYLAKTRGRQNYSETDSEISTKTYSTQRTFWRSKLEDRLRIRGTASNSQGRIIEYLPDATFFMRSGATGDSENSFSPDGNSSLDLSVWPLDADGPANDLIVFEAGTRWYNGNVSASNGELSTFKMYTIFHRDMQPTASLQFDHVQHIPHSGTAGSEYVASSSYFSVDNLSDAGTQAANTVQLRTQIPKWRTNKLAGKDPWYDSYDDYAADIRLMAKDYSVLPEFKISDHMDFYLENGFFNKTPKDFLIVPGAKTNTSASSDSAEGSVDNQFYKIYSHSDFLKHFEVIREDQKGIDDFNQKKNYPDKPVEKITLSCNAIMKLLPYNGFYPVLRTVQLGQMLSQSFGDYLGPDNIQAYGDMGRADKQVDHIRLQALQQPFFAPGIMYNSIKSGLAVDWPTFTGAPSQGVPDSNDVQDLGGWVGFISGGAAGAGPNYRLPFESLIEPQRYLPQTASDGGGAMFLIQPGLNVAESAHGEFTETPVYFDWNGTYNPKYSLAMHNFAAEIPEFFLKEKSFSRFVSKKQTNGFQFHSGSTYYMDVVLKRTEDLIMYEGPGRLQTYKRNSSDPSIVASARGCFYGPPTQVFGQEKNTEYDNHFHSGFVRSHYDPAFAPYTPPYFYGTSIATLQFNPHAQRDMMPDAVEEFSLSEIFQNVKYNLINEASGTYNLAEYSPVETIGGVEENLLLLSNAENEIAGKDCMQISASVELFGMTRLKKFNYDVIEGEDGIQSTGVSGAEDAPNADNDAWVIGTKFECPVLNFTGTGGPAKGTLDSALTDDQKTIFPSPLGMWKGYGEFPKTDEGIFLTLKESNQFVTATETEKVETVGSLLQTCGFKADVKKRIGDIADEKKISEAVVAIPMDNNGNFFPIEKAIFQQQLDDCNINLDTGTVLPNGEKTQTSITMMIDKMKRFYVPPHLDFLRNPNVDPFVMYIFEFEHVMNKQDLADVWQGVMPRIATRAKQSRATITHHVNTPFEFFGNWGTGFPMDQTNIRWMVFKIKQRAKNNYFGKSPLREQGQGFSFQAVGMQGQTLEDEFDYSYNWPYDFFSLVELASIDTEFRIGSGVKNNASKNDYYDTLYAEPSTEEQLDSTEPE